MPFLYRPMLKTKTGEASALLQLSPAERDRIEPVFHVGERPPATFVARMTAAWSGRRCFLDGAFNFNVTGGPGDFNGLIRGLAAAGRPGHPGDRDRCGRCLQSGSAVSLRSRWTGLMLKCTPNQLPAGGHLRAAAAASTWRY